MPGTAVVHMPAPTSDLGDARAERFLARVAALTPAEWGRLDAIGAEWVAPDVWGAIRRARSIAELLETATTPLPFPFRILLAGVPVVALTVDLAGVAADEVRQLVGRPLTPRWMRRPGGLSGGARGAGDAAPSPDVAAGRRMLARLQRLHDLAAAQPGGLGPSVAVLTRALAAATLAGAEPSAVGTRRFVAPLYGPVESVIPFASLG